MARPSLAQIKRRLKYAEDTLASGAGLTFSTRTELEKSAAALRSQLVGRCSICRRELTNPKSVAAGIGPECCKRVAA